MLIIPPSWIAMATTAGLPITRLKVKNKNKNNKYTVKRTYILILGISMLAITQSTCISIAGTTNLDFGRYSERLARCKVSSNGINKSLHICEQIRIQQHLDGLLSIRFSLSDTGRYGSNGTVFAGVVSKGSKSMICDGDGRCKPRLPLILEVNAISTTIYDNNGLVLTLPLGLVARGSCRIESLRAQCEATALDGASWRANGFFTVLPPPTSKEPPNK